MSLNRWLTGLAAAAIAMVASQLPDPAPAQSVTGRIEALGFQADTQAGCVVRAGQWFPVRVRLTRNSAGTAACTLRLETLDLDGDRVSFTSPQVTLSAEGGSAQRRLWCYAVVNALEEMPPSLDLLDERGVVLGHLPLPPCDRLLNDDLLVLDISPAPVVGLNLLQSYARAPDERAEGLRDYYRNVLVSRLPAAELPDRWWGLEAVDVIVWDGPDPASLSLAQTDALVEWVRRGGRLLLGIGSRYGALRSSGLAELLPYEGAGTGDELNRLSIVQSRMGAPLWKREALDNPVAVTLAPLAHGAAQVMPELDSSGQAMSLIAQRPAGSGCVMATASGLRELSRAIGDERRVYALLLGLNSWTREFKEAQAQKLLPITGQTLELHDALVEPVSFGTTSAWLAVAAFLFVVGYILLATLGAWWWLRLRKLTRVSWPVFAGCAVAASGLSLVTVAAVRGVGSGVQSLCILDMDAGADTARGTCYFGYRSPLRRRVELSLPGEGQYVRAMTRRPDEASYYVTPARYAAEPARGRPAEMLLSDVLVRATLKQVEGRWQGPLAGTLRGELVANRTTGRLTPTSWLANELPVDIDGGYLLYIDPRLDDGGVPARAAGLTRVYTPDLPDQLAAKVKWDYSVAPPSANVIALLLPPIKTGQRAAALGAAAYQQLDASWGEWAGYREPKRSEMPDLTTLWRVQHDWRSVLSGYTLNRSMRPIAAALLASTRDLHLNNRASHPADPAADVPLCTDGLVSLDITPWLTGGPTGGEALWIAWTWQPGPARLSVDGTPATAYKGLTIYRVRIPLGYAGHPPGEEARP